MPKDWSGEFSSEKGFKYTGREIHLTSEKGDRIKTTCVRGFGIERKRNGANQHKEGPYYYFLGDPHTAAGYNADASDWYGKLLKSIANAWDASGTPPAGKVNAPGGHKAHYRGTSIWTGSGEERLGGE